MGRGRQFESEGVDPRSGLQRRTAGEWRAYYFFKDLLQEAVEEEERSIAAELVILGEKDLREAECFHNTINSVWSSDDWRPEAYDAHLFTLVAMFYLSHLLKNNDSEFQACLGSVNVTEATLRHLIDFSLSLSSCEFQGFSDDMLAVEAVERIWRSRICTCSVDAPNALEIVGKIVHSTYFLSPPARYVDGPGCATALAFIRDRIKQMKSSGGQKPQLVEMLEKIEREVSNFYVREAVPFEDKDWEEYYRRSFMIYSGYPGYDHYPEPIENLLAELEPPSWGQLRSGHVKELLSALVQSRLLQALVSHRPPKSVFLSHLLAVYDCTTHARLWMLRSRLAPYSAFRHLTYDALGRRKKVGQDEQELEALESSLGFLERVPSCIEKLQKREAIHAHDACESKKDQVSSGIVFPLSSPTCPQVLVPCYLQSGGDVWTLDGLRHPLVLLIEVTFWYESKLELFVNDKDKLHKYLDTPRFLSYVEDIRDNYTYTPTPED